MALIGIGETAAFFWQQLLDAWFVQLLGVADLVFPGIASALQHQIRVSNNLNGLLSQG